MNNENESSSGRLMWVLGMALIPVLYFLSVGPVLLLFKNSPHPPDKVLKTIYYPLILLHDHTFLKKPIEAYCDLWGVH
jgi:hypothetical protein